MATHRAERYSYDIGYNGGKDKAYSKLIAAVMVIEYLRSMINKEVPQIPKFTL